MYLLTLGSAVLSSYQVKTWDLNWLENMSLAETGTSVEQKHSLSFFFFFYATMIKRSAFLFTSVENAMKILKQAFY